MVLMLGLGVSRDVSRALAIRKDEFKDTPNIVAAMKHAKENSGRLHLMGLVSHTQAPSSEQSPDSSHPADPPSCLPTRSLMAVSMPTFCTCSSS